MAAHSTPQGKQTPHLFRTLLIEFNHWMFDRIEQHNLGWIIEHKTLASPQLTMRESGKTTVGILRSHLGDEPEWQANDDPEWRDGMEAGFSTYRFPLFEPFMAHGTLNGKPAFLSGKRDFKRVTDVLVAGKSFQVVQHEGTFSYATGIDTWPKPDPQPVNLVPPSSKASKNPRRPSTSPKRNSVRTKSASRPSSSPRKQ